MTDLTAALSDFAARPRVIVASDFDGTLAPIVADPAAARALPQGRTALESLAALPNTDVALISGRSLADLGKLSGAPAGVLLIGTHGTEYPPGRGPASPLTTEQRALHETVVAELRAIADPLPGTQVEVKPSGAALHYRNASRPDAERADAAVLAGPAARDGVTLLRGKQVVELSVITGDKGTAIENLRTAAPDAAVLFVGDDVTDEHAFAVLTGPHDLGVKVGEGASAADWRIPDPAAVADMLQELARQRAAG